VDQTTLSDLDGTRLDREGDTVRYAHELGASGPFGDEAPGPWRPVAGVAPAMLGRLARHHALSARGWLARTPLGGRLRARTRDVVKGVAPSLDVGRRVTRYRWYDLHARLGGPS
jgi:hypothetical protein